MAAVSVGTTATRLDTVLDDTALGQGIAVWNDSDATIFIDTTANVTTSGATKGYPVAAGTAGPAIDLPRSQGLWGIVVTGTKSMIVLEVSAG